MTVAIKEGTMKIQQLREIASRSGYVRWLKSGIIEQLTLSAKNKRSDHMARCRVRAMVAAAARRRARQEKHNAK
jgi:hypothetical protein